MSTPNPSAEGGQEWPADKLAALRLGRRLVAEVPTGRPDRRAFVDVTPFTVPADIQARRQGWQRTDPTRGFRLTHWEYDAGRILGFDYDIGAVLLNEATAPDEPALAATLEAWHLHPEQFRYPWQTDDPR
ncbi:hypothetical protein SAMN05216223_11064 [Actinacidiphila yanglinensis]|uniref:Uncharacterized protein n=1 Tax=Actinacidiphila yanglinensis TaxID=310779 RepID=A0A1H6CTD5_9ACTN|nr:hypothetical protein [Actinacidiphila yanglinensis]SEG76224.1 hypothetical protein SAMN05216223_11064 [Actinacidiphila yanglinensis]